MGFIEITKGPRKGKAPGPPLVTTKGGRLRFNLSASELVRANFPNGTFSAWYDDKTKEFQLCRNEAGPWKLINQGRVCYLYSKDIYEVVGGERTFHVRQLKPGVLLLSPRLGTK